METVRVDVCYRPLRIGWAVRAGDFNALPSAARLSFALWGGRFNPIIPVDNQEAESLIDTFRVDMVLPIGDSETVLSFPKRFPHLINPFFHEGIFVGDDVSARSQVLDIDNALVHLQGIPEWKVTEEKLHLYTWSPDDALADVFLLGTIRAPTKSILTIASLWSPRLKLRR